jgi:hypothetical protein
MPLARFDMRWPSWPDVEDAMEVRVCRKHFWNRLHGAIWILFSNWRP